MTQIVATGRTSIPAQQSQSGPIILLYHRVATPPMDPQLLCVSPDRFAEHLQTLNTHGRIISMRELVVAIRGGTPLPSDAFVITFDDGYADNLHQALPLLEAENASATIFIATGDLECNVEFWWDQLERIILVQESLSTSLTLRIEKQTYDWVVEPADSATQEGSVGETSWNVLTASKPSSRQMLYRELFDLLRPLTPAVLRSCIEQLNQWSGVTIEARKSHRRMSKAEIATLGGCEMVELGAHTVNHPVLSTLPGETQFAEIVESKRAIENIIGRGIFSFSYPFGTKRDYSAETVHAVNSAGFFSACANYENVVAENTALFELPRMLVRDWSSERLLERFDEVRCVRRACG